MVEGNFAVKNGDCFSGVCEGFFWVVIEFGHIRAFNAIDEESLKRIGLRTHSIGKSGKKISAHIRKYSIAVQVNVLLDFFIRV